jgi:hypothetical protein
MSEKWYIIGEDHTKYPPATLVGGNKEWFINGKHIRNSPNSQSVKKTNHATVSNNPVRHLPKFIREPIPLKIRHLPKFIREPISLKKK